MGRQKQRAKGRRKQTAPVQRGGSGKGAVVGGVVVILAVVAGFTALAIHASSGTVASPTAVPTSQPNATPPSLAQKIDGIPCNVEMLSYHVHAHLSIYDRGRPVVIPANVGITNTCLYWLHTHDSSGIIHVEGPYVFPATLGKFFDVWGEPLSRSRVAGASVKSGERMKIWVNGRPYSGNPRSIPLRDHTTITVAIGPPFPKPQPYDFSSVE